MNLDRAGAKLYLRLVYVGPAASGKSTVLRTLLPAMGVKDAGAVLAHPDPREGSTRFEWAEYEGGLYQDCRIRCQIVAAVGSDALREVRRKLVEESDAIVFVADARRSRVKDNTRSFAELRPWLERPGSRLEVVLQLTRTGDPSALAADEFRRTLALDETAEIYGDSERDIQRGFVASVRAGLRRTDALRSRNQLHEGVPVVMTGAQLLKQLEHIPEITGEDAAPVRSGRPAVMPMAAWKAMVAPPPIPDLDSRLDSRASRESERRPQAPRVEPAESAGVHAEPEVPQSTIERKPASGRQGAARPAIMPMADWLRSLEQSRPAAPAQVTQAPSSSTPVQFAVVRRPDPRLSPAAPSSPFELAAAGPPTPWFDESSWDLVEASPPAMWASVRGTARLYGPGTDWTNLGHGWRARASTLTEDPVYPRAEYKRLLAWFVGARECASRNRCIALVTAAPHRRWCVMQFVQRPPTLDGLVRAALEPGLAPRRVAHLLARAAEGYLLASSEFEREGVRLPVRLATITRMERRPVYTDFFPARPADPSDDPPLQRLEGELRGLLATAPLADSALGAVVNELKQMVDATPSLFPVVSVLQTSLMES